MGKATRRVAAAFAVAAASTMVIHGTAAAEPEAAAEHKVTYTVVSAGGADVDLFYLTTQPPNKEAYNADAYAFVKNEKVTLAPGVPWVFETDLADPQWAILTVSSTTHGGRAAPNPHCEIAVDGQLAVQQDAPYNPRCQLGQW